MDENQSLQNLEKLLKTWSTNICETTKEIIVGALGRYPETMTNYTQDIMEDIRDRQSRVISVRTKNLPFFTSFIQFLSIGNPRSS